MTATVQYVARTTTNGASAFTLTITDVTQSESFTINIPQQAASGGYGRGFGGGYGNTTQAQRSSAEWIVEAPFLGLRRFAAGRLRNGWLYHCHSYDRWIIRVAERFTRVRCLGHRGSLSNQHGLLFRIRLLWFECFNIGSYHIEPERNPNNHKPGPIHGYVRPAGRHVAVSDFADADRASSWLGRGGIRRGWERVRLPPNQHSVASSIVSEGRCRLRCHRSGFRIVGLARLERPALGLKPPQAQNGSEKIRLIRIAGGGRLSPPLAFCETCEPCAFTGVLWPAGLQNTSGRRPWSRGRSFRHP